MLLSSAPRLRPLLTPAPVLLAALCSSCSPNPGPSLHPVRGKVFFQNRPAEEAYVVFHPAGESDPQAPKPYGHVGKDGSFQLITHGSGDGAPAGDYAVTIVWLARKSEASDETFDRLKGRFADPKTSGLRARVKAEPNELEPFQLK